MNHRDQFIQNFFQLVEPYPYVLLKHMDKIEESSDLDILLDNARTKKVMPILVTDPSVEKYKLLMENTMWQLFLYFKDNSFLQIDFLFGFYRKELVYLDKVEVENTAVREANGWRVCRLPHLAEHVFLFNLLNYAPVPQKYLEYFAGLESFERNEIEKHIQEKFKLMMFNLNDMREYNPDLRRKVVQQLQQREENNFAARVQRKLEHYWNRFTQLSPQKGMTITFSGVDGAGKSTIIEEVKETLTRKYRRKVVVIRHRPSLLPILSAYKHGKAEAERRAATTLPRQGNNKKSWSSMLRFAYYYSDYLFGQFYVYFKYHLRSYIVLYDRYYFDFIVDGRRSNIQLNNKVPKFLYRFIHQPDLNLFLYAKPEVIRKRKKELEEDAIVELTDKYKTLFEKLRNEQKGDLKVYLSIENEDKQETLDTIFEQYKKLV